MLQTRGRCRKYVSSFQLTVGRVWSFINPKKHPQKIYDEINLTHLVFPHADRYDILTPEPASRTKALFNTLLIYLLHFIAWSMRHYPKSTVFYNCCIARHLFSIDSPLINFSYQIRRC